jgi:hypothetical protein
MKNYITVFLFSVLSVSVSGQVANFTATDITTGNSISLYDFKSSPGVVIIFTSSGTACPYDQYYQSRLRKIAKDFTGKIPVLFVDSHLAESDEDLNKTAAALGTTLLVDRDQKIMQLLKATKSPEAVVLKSDGGNFSMYYRGAVDDNAQVPADVHENYLADAINSLLNGGSPKSAEVRPTGCMIRRK